MGLLADLFGIGDINRDASNKKRSLDKAKKGGTEFQKSKGESTSDKEWDSAKREADWHNIDEHLDGGGNVSR